MELPADLRSALERELRSVSPKHLADIADQLSQRYRAGHARSQQRYIQSPDDAVAYAAYRMPATYAAVAAACAATRAQLAGWQPRSMLDIGSGPGTAMWAAHAVWPTIGQWTLLERESAMLGFGKRLAQHALDQALREARWRQADLLQPWQAPAHDLGIAAYLLGELPRERQRALLQQLWASAQTIIIIEPGTPRGFELIREARSSLLAEGAPLVAPCPHSTDCPLAAGDWCHFSQRIGRTKMQRAVKQAERGFEDEKFSYIAFSRQPVTPIRARVLRHPQVEPGRIQLELCTAEGLSTAQVGKRNRGAFREARSLVWGSALADFIDEQAQQEP